MKSLRPILILIAACLPCWGCGQVYVRPWNVPRSAAWADGTFISCSAGDGTLANHCVVYKDSTGEILADGFFSLSGRAAKKNELRYVRYYSGFRGSVRVIDLENGRSLSMQAAAERDPVNRLIEDRLKALSAAEDQETIDCGTTTMHEPTPEVSECAQFAFEAHKPFRVRYSLAGGIPIVSYGLAGDSRGNLYQVRYDTWGLLNYGLSKNEKAFDDNHIRVTKCIQPVALAKTEEGTLACTIPINQAASASAARQKPTDTTVCQVVKYPSAFNNKLVRLQGYVSGNFEYSLLDGDGCDGSIWFAYPGGGGPPGLVITVDGGATIGEEDSEGRRILAVPVKLVEDARFRRFQGLMERRAKADEMSAKLKPDEYVFHRVTATMVGRIDAVTEDIHAFHLKRGPTDSADFLGFGQMGLYDAQFVLQSVVSDPVLGVEPRAGAEPLSHH